MQIVIDISEDTYNQVREGFYEENVGKLGIAVIDGTVQYWNRCKFFEWRSDINANSN